MAYVAVVPAEKGKFKVLVDWVQRGIAYSSKALADKEASAIKEKILSDGGVVKE